MPFNIYLKQLDEVFRSLDQYADEKQLYLRLPADPREELVERLDCA